MQVVPQTLDIWHLRMGHPNHAGLAFTPTFESWFDDWFPPSEVFSVRRMFSGKAASINITLPSQSRYTSCLPPHRHLWPDEIIWIYR